MTFLKKREISDYSENISLIVRINVPKSVIPDVFAWQWAMYVDNPMKMFSLLIDIFFSSDLYMKLVKSTLIIVSCFFAQIYLGILIIKPNFFHKYFILNNCPMQLHKHIFALLIILEKQTTILNYINISL